MASIVLRVDPSFDPEMYDNTSLSWSKTSYNCWSLDGKRTKKENEENIWSLEERKNAEGKYLEKEICYENGRMDGRKGVEGSRKSPQRSSEKKWKE